MLFKPVAESSDKSWLIVCVPNRFTRADAAIDQASMEKLRSKRRVKADLCALEMRALATAQMVSKGLEYVEIGVRQSEASPLQKAAEMGGGSNVSSGDVRGVSIAFEVICERVDVWSTDSAAKASQRLGC